MPRIRPFLPLLALLLATGPPVGASPEGDRRPSLVVNDPDWPPYSFAGDADRPRGFAKELVEACLPATGYPFHFQPYSIVRMYQALESGDIDVQVMSWEPDRERIAQYGRIPLFTSGYRPIARTGSGLEVHSAADLDGLRLGAIRGVKHVGWYQDYLRQRDAEGTVEWAPTNDTVLRMLLAQRIDVFVSTVETARWIADEMGASERIEVLDFDVKTSDYFVTVSRASRRVDDPQQLLDQFDRCLVTLKASATYRDLERRYRIR